MRENEREGRGEGGREGGGGSADGIREDTQGDLETRNRGEGRRIEGGRRTEDMGGRSERECVS